MWVFKYKTDEDGYFMSYKARLCARGDLYRDREQETYAATLATRVFRTLMSTTNHFDLEIQQLDAVNAFTNAHLDAGVTIYIEDPEGFPTPSSTVLLLHRALYGLPQSPLLWYNELCTTMRQLGLKPVPESACLFTSSTLIVFFFVDDICILHHRSNTDAYHQFRTQLFLKYKMRDIGELKWFLGVRVVRDRIRRRIWLCQDAYIAKIAAKFRLTNQSLIRTPIV